MSCAPVLVGLEAKCRKTVEAAVAATAVEPLKERPDEATGQRFEKNRDLFTGELGSLRCVEAVDQVRCGCSTWVSELVTKNHYLTINQTWKNVHDRKDVDMLYSFISEIFAMKRSFRVSNDTYLTKRNNGE